MRKKVYIIGSIVLLLIMAVATQRVMGGPHKKAEVLKEIQLTREIESTEVNKDIKNNDKKGTRENKVDNEEEQLDKKQEVVARKEAESTKRNEATKPIKKLSVEEVAKKVIEGKYGNGENRKRNIEADGYNYIEVQEVVQKMLPKPQRASKSVTEGSGNSKPTSKVRTDGFNFKGYHFSLASFSGDGDSFVPKETNNVYSWTTRPSHYLIERISPAGRVIKQLNVGDKLVINGQSYRVHSRKSGVPNDDNAYGVLTGTSADISLQTCDTTKGPTGRSDLTLWWANKE